MRKIVEVREGIDKRNIFYAHSRYENYFAKGLLRRMTEFFWWLILWWINIIILKEINNVLEELEYWLKVAIKTGLTSIR